MKRTVWIIGLALILVALNACGSPKSTAETGKELFARSTLDDQPGCITCHSLEADTIIIGPSVAGIASRAGNMVAGLSAEEYLRQSIVDPNIFLVPGFPKDTMPPVWEQRLSEQQVNELVAYMMELK